MKVFILGAGKVGRALAAALKTKKVKVTLRDQGKEWRSLERWQYIDGQICFWLNPADQSRYRMGWFSIDDLIQWSHDVGPVMLDEELDDEDALAERRYDLVA